MVTRHRKSQESRFANILLCYSVMLCATMVDRQIELRLNLRKRQLADLHSREDFGDWVFCCCTKCHDESTPLLHRLDLCCSSTAYAHIKKYAPAIEEQPFVSYEEYCSLYRSYLSGNTSVAGQPLSQPALADQPPSIPARLPPAFSDDHERYRLPEVQQDLGPSIEEGLLGDNGSEGSGSDGNGSGGGGFSDEGLGPLESSQPAATYGARTGLLGRWANWWFGGYTEEDDSQDPPQTATFYGPVNRPSADELRGRLPGNDGAKSVNVTLEEAEGSAAVLTLPFSPGHCLESFGRAASVIICR